MERSITVVAVYLLALWVITPREIRIEKEMLNDSELTRKRANGLIITCANFIHKSNGV